MANPTKIQNNKAAGISTTPALNDYLQANLWWWGFLALLAVIAYFICGAVWDDVTSGVLEFIFVIMGGGFTLVSALDYNYEKYLSNSQGEPKK